MELSVAEAHNHLSRWLNKLPQGPITITRRGSPGGVIILPEDYDRLQRVAACMQMLRLSHVLKEDQNGATADGLYRLS